MSTVQITAGDGGTFDAFVARPSTPNGRGVLVLQEIFGINEFVRATAEAFAAEGYTAYAPDLFWRIRPGIDLGYSPEDWQEAFGLFGQFDVDTGIGDVDATLQAMRNDSAITAAVGCVGYCLGGKLAALTAMRTSIDGSVGYYGVGLDAFADEVGAISRPAVFHVAGEDSFMSAEARQAFAAACATNPLVTVYDYPGREHAFARPQSENYDASDAATANARTAAFFAAL